MSVSDKVFSTFFRLEEITDRFGASEPPFCVRFVKYLDMFAFIWRCWVFWYQASANQ